ncbi:hypothetical protein [Kitasatospora sp. NPDC091207]|uniref:hypothetical protein n=1 Tax=Kitasatospora sp. NPDC091207 TaxID=3364083 RepID=UPI00382B431A
MLRRILATTAALGAALTGTVFAAPAASAQEAGYACRSDTTPNHAWANWAGANIDSCIAHQAGDFASIVAGIGINNAFPSDPCAQLVDVSTGKWLYDYGCVGWVAGGSGNHYFNRASTDLARTGHQVVVQVGFWADFGSGLQYYMNVQSPRFDF